MSVCTHDVTHDSGQFHTSTSTFAAHILHVGGKMQHKCGLKLHSFSNKFSLHLSGHFEAHPCLKMILLTHHRNQNYHFTQALVSWSFFWNFFVSIGSFRTSLFKPILVFVLIHSEPDLPAFINASTWFCSFCDFNLSMPILIFFWQYPSEFSPWPLHKFF